MVGRRLSQVNLPSQRDLVKVFHVEHNCVLHVAIRTSVPRGTFCGYRNVRTILEKSFGVLELAKIPILGRGSVSGPQPAKEFW
jgi:hypothetical protein